MTERSGRRESGRGSDRGSSRRGTYEYKERSADAYKKRGDQSSNQFDTYLKDTIKLYKPRDGDNDIRILPPTWEEAEHFGFELWVHYSIGPDNQAYLCLDKHKGEACPVCEERAKAVSDGDTEYGDKLKANKRVAVYLIDRLDEKEGPMVWAAPWTVDRDICKLVVDKRTGEALPIDHPEDGYDIQFERKGKGQRTEYIGMSIARRSSELGDDSWLDFVQENPLPELLNFYEYEHIQAVFHGTAKSKESEDDQPSGRRRKNTDDEKDTSTRRRRSEPEADWDSIHEMSFDQMVDFIQAKDINIDPEESKDDADLADWICEELKIKKQAAPRERKRTDDAEEDAPSARDRLRKMRENRG